MVQVSSEETSSKVSVSIRQSDLGIDIDPDFCEEDWDQVRVQQLQESYPTYPECFEETKSFNSECFEQSKSLEPDCNNLQ